jgi:uncharacterized protein YcsI (UPF0317 family)
MSLRIPDSTIEARAGIRAGEHVGPTSSLAPGFAQANLAVLPADLALDFLRFCVRNPKPCPVLEVTATGSARPTTMAPEADLRTDLPRYRVFRDGTLVDEPTDVTQYWRDDLVAFLLGCSFTFDWALGAAGLPPAHQTQGVNVPMYVTNRQCVGTGRFVGPLVVSMRPFAPDDIRRAADISARFPAMHGGPVHVGDPGVLGIDDLNAPDFGDPVLARRRSRPRLLGLRRHATVCRDPGPAVAGDLSRTRPHVHHRSTPRRLRLSGGGP